MALMKYLFGPMEILGNLYELVLAILKIVIASTPTRNSLTYS